MMKKETVIVVSAGAAVGLAAIFLMLLGNPANMGFCIACFLRDIAGACGLHNAAKVQYVRPEIIGLVLGALAMSLATREFRARAGSAPAVRFVLGGFVMIGALAFLGCPLRMVLRLGGGDLNALVGLIGFTIGICIGIVFLKKGFTLGRSYEAKAVEGGVLPIVMAVLLILVLAVPALFKFSEEGPGSKHAPFFIALVLALIVGALAERIRFSAVLIFVVVWMTLSYIPIAHMVWGGGLLATHGALDFAGGTVVHINAAVAGLVGAYMMGKRVGFGKEAFKPHNLPMVFTGTAILYVGWFGFNAGSASAANEIAGLAFVNTVVATAAAILAWTFGEWATRGKPSLLGACSGAIAGLVGITPACGYIGVGGSLIVGIAAGLAGLWGVTALKRVLRVDDPCDVFGVHGVCGIVGCILTGIFAATSLGGVGYAEGVTMGHQLLVQLESIAITVVWSGVVAFIGYKVADMTVGLRVPEEQEREGLDVNSHGENAYNA